MDELERNIARVCNQKNLDWGLMFQNREEFLTLCRYVQAFKPNNFLEIGCLGASFNILSSLCTGKKVAVDLVDNSAKLEDPEAIFICGNSKDVFGRVSQVCSRFDFIFIDGDHTYDGVSHDFWTYKTLLNDGGFIAFHDIDPEHTFRDMEGGAVYRFWQDLKIGNKINIVCTGTNHDLVFQGQKTHFGGIGIWRP